MRTRGLLLAIPSLAMAVVGFAMLGPGTARPFDGAQVWGGPTEGARRLSWRIAVIQRLRGIDSTRDIGAVVVHAANGNQESTIRCRTRADGTCDVELKLAGEVRGQLHASITKERDGEVLATGYVGQGGSQWGTDPGHRARMGGKNEGELQLELYARRGIFAVPFRDELTVMVKRSMEPVRAARVTLRADTADLDGASSDDGSVTRTTGVAGDATFGVTPRSHVIEVNVEAAMGGRSVRWTGTLPVVPGAIWLDPAGVAAGKIRVLAPVPRELVYATLATKAFRVWGGVVPLLPDAGGFAGGEIDWPETSTAGLDDLWLTLASDPRASGSGTVGWPIDSAGGPVYRDEQPFRDLLLLDGMPWAERREKGRRRRARMLSASVLGAAAILEGVLLAETSFKKGARSWAWLAVAIATVVLAFAAIGVVMMWKTSG
jgi:hypothetical protein